MNDPFDSLPAGVAGTIPEAVARELARKGWAALKESGHGDQPRWQKALEALPLVAGHLDAAMIAPVLGQVVGDPEALKELLMEFHPWRKGPLVLGGTKIDTEWRSDLKWNRVAPHVDLTGSTVLDVGCGNGYFGWRMLGAGAHCVVGIDPTMVYVYQWLAQRHFAGPANNFVLPLRDTDLPERLTGFDAVFSMGVLYHRKNPANHLEHLYRSLRPGGSMIMETLIIEGMGNSFLAPVGRYARMRNVWQLPTQALLEQHIADAGFKDIKTVDITATTSIEQRTTPWMQFESLDKCLDPADFRLTVEGHPAPVRAITISRKP